MTTEPNKRTIDTYNQVAPLYVERHLQGGVWESVPEPAFTHFTSWLPAGARVLDIGCGPGHHVRLLRKAGFQPIGVDLSFGMLAQAQQYSDDPLVLADMLWLPFADGYADGVWMCASLLHLPREYAPHVFHEARRVLRGGSPLYASVQQGDGDTVKFNLGNQGRYFTFYQPDELHKLVTQADLLSAGTGLSRVVQPRGSA